MTFHEHENMGAVRARAEDEKKGSTRYERRKTSRKTHRLVVALTGESLSVSVGEVSEAMGTEVCPCCNDFAYACEQRVHKLRSSAAARTTGTNRYGWVQEASNVQLVTVQVPSLGTQGIFP
jgi:hypothetical protein